MSLMGGLLLIHLRGQGVQLSVDDGRLRAVVPSRLMTPEIKDTIAIYRVELIELLEAEAKVKRLDAEIMDLIERAGNAYANGDYPMYDHLTARRLEMANGPLIDALERLIDLAGDGWVELVESKPVQPVQRELVGVR